ncbi:MAG: hypothetical protein HYY01_05415 [Chloroflexi bacterium]|nr:hypothetical protein [Chloroflexota bacterium]
MIGWLIRRGRVTVFITVLGLVVGGGVAVAIGANGAPDGEDALQVVRDYGPNPAHQAAKDLDWSSLASLASVSAGDITVHLADGRTFDGQRHILMVALEPDEKVNRMRPAFAVESGEVDGKPTFLALNLPGNKVYAGFVNANPSQPIRYTGEDGARRLANVSSPQGIVFLAQADPHNPDPGQDLGGE